MPVTVGERAPAFKIDRASFKAGGAFRLASGDDVSDGSESIQSSEGSSSNESMLAALMKGPSKPTLTANDANLALNVVADNEAARREISRLRDYTQRLEAQLRAFQMRDPDFDTSRVQFRQQSSISSFEMEKLSPLLLSYDIRVKSLEHALVQAKESLEQQSSQVDTLESENAELRAEIETKAAVLLQQIDKAKGADKSTVDLLEKRIEAQEKQNKLLRSALSEKAGELDSYQTSVEQLESQVTSLAAADASAEQLLARVKLLESDASQREATVAKLRHDLREESSRSESLRGELERLILSAEAAQQTSQEQVQKLQNSLSEAQRRLQTRDESAAGETARADAAEQRAHALDGVLEDWRSQNEQLAQAAVAANKTVETLRHSRNAAVERCASLEIQLADTRTDADVARRRVTRLKALLNSLQQSSADRESEVYQRASEKTRRLVEQLQASTLQQAQSLRVLREEVRCSHDAQQASARAQKQAESEARHALSALAQEERKTACELAESRRRAVAAEAELQCSKRRLAEAHDELRRGRETWRRAVDESARRLGELERALEHAQNQAAAANKAAEQAEARLSEVHRHVAQLEAEHQRDVATATSRTMSLHHAVSDVRRQKSDELHRERSQRHREKQLLLRKIAHLQSSLSQLQQRAATAENDAARLSEQLSLERKHTEGSKLKLKRRFSSLATRVDHLAHTERRKSMEEVASRKRVERRMERALKRAAARVQAERDSAGTGGRAVLDLGTTAREPMARRVSRIACDLTLPARPADTATATTKSPKSTTAATTPSSSSENQEPGINRRTQSTLSTSYSNDFENDSSLSCKESVKLHAAVAGEPESHTSTEPKPATATVDKSNDTTKKNNDDGQEKEARGEVAEQLEIPSPPLSPVAPSTARSVSQASSYSAWSVADITNNVFGLSSASSSIIDVESDLT